MALSRRPGAGTNQEAVRRHNLGTVLGHVHHRGQVSRAELTASMGLNRSTIAALVGELESLGLVAQGSPRRIRGGAGRPSLDVVPGRLEAYVLATDLRVDQITVARVGLGGQILARDEAPTPADHRPQNVVPAVAQLLRGLVRRAPRRSAVVGVAVGIPAVLSDRAGLVRFGPNLGWTDVPFQRDLAELLGPGIAVRAGNDADLGALSEHTHGAGVGFDDIVYISGDVGVGGGVVSAGRALHGVGGYAGEIGHLKVTPRGRTCRCGRRGCWETEVGAEAVAAALGIGAEEMDRLPEVLSTLSRPPAALRAIGRSLGSGIASVVNLFNPELVILGGLFRFLYPAVSDEVDAAFGSEALVAPSEQARVVLPVLGQDSVLMGAAELGFEALLRDPARVLADTAGVGPTILDRAG